MKLITKAAFTDRVTDREKQNLELAYAAACESVVLLENRGVLPLKHRKVALYGPGATRTTKGGTGSGEVNERHSVNILEGLESRGFAVSSRSWLRQYEEEYTTSHALYRKNRSAMAWRFPSLRYRKIRDHLCKVMLMGVQPPEGRDITPADVEESATDTCIYVISRQAGEGGDRRLEKGDYYISDSERRALEFCAANYANVVVLINCGVAIDMSFLEEIPNIGAVLHISQPGTQGGLAVADILSGQVCPSGCLADTWARQYADIPFSGEYSYLNGNLQEENYQEGIYVGYRYFDSFGLQPRYPFGYGLSYTEFSVECAGVSLEGTRADVKALVTNTGTVAGKKVVQLYASAPADTLDREYQSLAAYGKTDLLQPGQKQELTLRFDLGQLGGYRESDNSYILEPGEYVLRLGHHSRDTSVAAVLELKQEVILSRHQAICPLEKAWQDIQSAPRQESLPDVPRLQVDSDAFTTRVHGYETPPVCEDPRVQAWLGKLSDREMVEIVVGVGQFYKFSRFKVPGSVGNTTSKLWDRGLVNVTLCDGPAGLRILRESTATKWGRVRTMSHALSVVDLMPDWIQKLCTGDPKREQPLYQYTTAFPVEAALAQTWNDSLLEEVGKAIYTEMKEYGCTFWLAPALNIHRNPLCGRNFEYFSEDPLLTGRLAAAITRGIQQEEGFYATIKHFACNNQEDNRLYGTSNVSQRALREIYLRGFGIAVEAGAKSVMTSYNRLNGVYTPNSYDLCTKVLRNEWGFDGVVMTDWESTANTRGTNHGALQAGNDLIMPGGKPYKKAVLEALRSGTLDREDLRRCCGNVLKAILNSDTQRDYMQ